MTFAAQVEDVVAGREDEAHAAPAQAGRDQRQRLGNGNGNGSTPPPPAHAHDRPARRTEHRRRRLARTRERLHRPPATGVRGRGAQARARARAARARPARADRDAAHGRRRDRRGQRGLRGHLRRRAAAGAAAGAARGRHRRRERPGRARRRSRDRRRRGARARALAGRVRRDRLVHPDPRLHAAGTGPGQARALPPDGAPAGGRAAARRDRRLAQIRTCGLGGALLALCASAVISLAVNYSSFTERLLGTEATKAATYLLTFPIVFVLVASGVRSRADVERCIKAIVVGGAVVAFCAIVETRTAVQRLQPPAHRLPVPAGHGRARAPRCATARCAPRPRRSTRSRSASRSRSACRSRSR